MCINYLKTQLQRKRVHVEAANETCVAKNPQNNTNLKETIPPMKTSQISHASLDVLLFPGPFVKS